MAKEADSQDLVKPLVEDNTSPNKKDNGAVARRKGKFLLTLSVAAMLAMATFHAVFCGRKPMNMSQAKQFVGAPWHDRHQPVGAAEQASIPAGGPYDIHPPPHPHLPPHPHHWWHWDFGSGDSSDDSSDDSSKDSHDSSDDHHWMRHSKWGEDLRKDSNDNKSVDLNDSSDDHHWLKYLKGQGHWFVDSKDDSNDSVDSADRKHWWKGKHWSWSSNDNSDDSEDESQKTSIQTQVKTPTN